MAQALHSLGKRKRVWASEGDAHDVLANLAERCSLPIRFVTDRTTAELVWLHQNVLDAPAEPRDGQLVVAPIGCHPAEAVTYGPLYSANKETPIWSYQYSSGGEDLVLVDLYVGGTSLGQYRVQVATEPREWALSLRVGAVAALSELFADRVSPRDLMRAFESGVAIIAHPLLGD